MKGKILNFLSVDLLKKAIALLILFVVLLTEIDSALAETVTSNTSNKARQAAEKVVEQKEVKAKFGNDEKSKRLIDNARDEAKAKLNDLAHKADSNENLPDSEKLFLKSVEGKY